MDRRHLILPAALLAGSALLAGRALIDSMPLGPDSEPAASIGQLVETTETTDDVGTRTAQLDAVERRLTALDAQRPPALPAVPSRTAAVASPGVAAMSGRRSDGHGGRGRDHPEDDGTVEHDRFDDHGGDRDRDDERDDDNRRHGGDDDRDDDRRHGGEGHDDGRHGGDDDD